MIWGNSCKGFGTRFEPCSEAPRAARNPLHACPSGWCGFGGGAGPPAASPDRPEACADSGRLFSIAPASVIHHPSSDAHECALVVAKIAARACYKTFLGSRDHESPLRFAHLVEVAAALHAVRTPRLRMVLGWSGFLFGWWGRKVLPRIEPTAR